MRFAASAVETFRKIEDKFDSEPPDLFDDPQISAQEENFVSFAGENPADRFDRLGMVKLLRQILNKRGLPRRWKIGF